MLCRKLAKRQQTNRTFLADDMTNSLLFQGSAAEWRQAEEVVALLDAPGKQVALEAQVVALNKKKSAGCRHRVGMAKDADVSGKK